jgi:hypothetical protein
MNQRLKSRRHKSIRGSTVKHTRKSLPEKTVQSKMVCKFLEMLTAIRVYHWSTTSYAEHKTTEELYKQLESLVDRFVETLNGKNQTGDSVNRIRMVASKMRLYDFANKSQLSKALFEFREFLVSLSDLFRPTSDDADILSIRDEMLAIVNQYLYLLTMK